jgi:hypothetical protein
VVVDLDWSRFPGCFGSGRFRGGLALAPRVVVNHMYLCTCEREAEKGDFGSCFRHPFHRPPACAPGRFNRMYGGNLFEKAARNSASGGCFQGPFHRTPTRGPRRFRLLRQALTGFEPPTQSRICINPRTLRVQNVLLKPRHVPLYPVFRDNLNRLHDAVNTDKIRRRS